ncbi:DinB family protein [Pseudalkalibacillus hwajinpoensis]|uniref:DinB family protein n=1 Tax=Guptibacillus hwajinpoensis TaxID=208199 RepID=A0A4U1MNN1_9BACL|nr:DinB family protein [Pseudalkalibacillus hwajinpoensis]TKD72305.1 DinB family protein [Pseudalkalibacillus hwajinpoensis]
MEQRHDILFNQLEDFRGYLLKVANVSEEEGEFVPKGFKNNIRWNLGHVYVELYMWIETLTKEKASIPQHFNEWFGWGSSPEHFTDETPSLEDLKVLLKSQLSDIKKTYGERLEEVFSPTEMWEMSTIEQVLRWTTFHEGMHLQAILDIRKCIKA